MTIHPSDRASSHSTRTSRPRRRSPRVRTVPGAPGVPDAEFPPQPPPIPQPAGMPATPERGNEEAGAAEAGHVAPPGSLVPDTLAEMGLCQA